MTMTTDTPDPSPMSLDELKQRLAAERQRADDLCQTAKEALEMVLDGKVNQTRMQTLMSIVSYHKMTRMIERSN